MLAQPKRVELPCMVVKVSLRRSHRHVESSPTADRVGVQVRVRVNIYSKRNSANNCEPARNLWQLCGGLRRIHHVLQQRHRNISNANKNHANKLDIAADSAADWERVRGTTTMRMRQRNNSKSSRGSDPLSAKYPRRHDVSLGFGFQLTSPYLSFA